MYLTKSIYVGAEYEHRHVTGSIDIKVDGKPLFVNFNQVSAIRERVGYWRKANQIHNWFVNTVQDGADDCKEYFVDTCLLEELLELCKRVQVDHSLAPDELPSANGFFFGTDEVECYDEWYFKGIDYTINLLNGILDKPDGRNTTIAEYYYRASW
jgi:hypothetical protein